MPMDRSDKRAARHEAALTLDAAGPKIVDTGAFDTNICSFCHTYLSRFEVTVLDQFQTVTLYRDREPCRFILFVCK